jgi:hypothetical protein
VRQLRHDQRLRLGANAHFRNTTGAGAATPRPFVVSTPIRPRSSQACPEENAALSGFDDEIDALRA